MSLSTGDAQRLAMSTIYLLEALTKLVNTITEGVRKDIDNNK